MPTKEEKEEAKRLKLEAKEAAKKEKEAAKAQKKAEKEVSSLCCHGGHLDMHRCVRLVGAASLASSCSYSSPDRSCRLWMWP